MLSARRFLSFRTALFVLKFDHLEGLVISYFNCRFVKVKNSNDSRDTFINSVRMKFGLFTL